MEEWGQMDKQSRDLIEIIHFTENVSLKIHNVLDEAEIYRTVKEEFAQSKRYTASILLLTDDGSKLRIAETSIPPGKWKAGEKAAVVRTKGYKIDLNKSSIYSQVVREGKTVQVNVSDTIAELFPRPLADLISKNMGYKKRPSILTPLKRHGKIIGALAISSTDLAEHFLPSVRKLAQHISIALELADEYAKRKRMEERLRLLSSAVEQSTEGISVSDLEGNLLFVNNAFAAMHGYTSEELVGKHLSIFHTPEQMPAVEAANLQIQETGEFSDEIWHVRRDGAVFPTLMHNSLLRDEVGNPIGMIGAVRDITKRKRAEEALKRRAVQLALINDIGGKIAAALDLDEVLDRATRLVQESFDYHHVALFILDREREEVVLRAAASSYVTYIPRDYRLKLTEGMVGWTATHGVTRLANDVSTDPHYVRGLSDDAMTQAELCVPIQVSGETIGVLDVQSPQLNAFVESDVLLMETLADQIAIAIENARLYQQTDEKLQTRVRELAALYAIAEVMTHPLDLDTILQLVLDSVMGLTGMDSGGILLLDPSTNEFFLRAHRGGSPELIRAVSHKKVDEGLMPRMLNSVLTIDNLSGVTKDRRVAIKKEGLQSLVSIPLKAKGSPLGVMVIASCSPRTFAPQELELLAAIGNQVGVAVDRANLQAQELRAAILEERQAMARQMHDDIAQTLGYLGLQVDSVMDSSSPDQNVEVQAELEGLRRAIEDAYERVRSSIMRLGEDVPGHFDLGAALPEIISEFEKQTGCRVESRVDRGQLSRLPPSVAFQATYIISEALTNVRKHSGADSVHLTLQGLEDGRIEVTIQDNGRGFDLDSEQQSGWGGFGLRFMRERAERVGGSLRVESQPGQGTRVVVSLPSG